MSNHVKLYMALDQPELELEENFEQEPQVLVAYFPQVVGELQWEVQHPVLEGHLVLPGAPAPCEPRGRSAHRAFGTWRL